MFLLSFFSLIVDQFLSNKRILFVEVLMLGFLWRSLRNMRMLMLINWQALSNCNFSPLPVPLLFSAIVESHSESYDNSAQAGYYNRHDHKHGQLRIKLHIVASFRAPSIVSPVASALWSHAVSTFFLTNSLLLRCLSIQGVFVT